MRCLFGKGRKLSSQIFSYSSLAHEALAVPSSDTGWNWENRTRMQQPAHWRSYRRTGAQDLEHSSLARHAWPHPALSARYWRIRARPSCLYCKWLRGHAGVQECPTCCLVGIGGRHYAPIFPRNRLNEGSRPVSWLTFHLIFCRWFSRRLATTPTWALPSQGIRDHPRHHLVLGVVLLAGGVGCWWRSTLWFSGGLPKALKS